MALVLLDRAQESATANTTVSFTLTGAQTGYQSLAGVGDTNTTYYGATDGTNWEVGIGTYSTTGPTLTRTTILASSAGGTTAVTFSGAVTVFVDYPAERAVYENESGVITGYPISGGTINNTPIGATTANTGTFTTLNSGIAAHGGTASTSQQLLIGGSSQTANTTEYGISNNQSVQSAVTTIYAGNATSIATQAASFTLGNLIHFWAQQATIGSGSTVTTQSAFQASATLTGATNNYAFNGSIASGTGRWNAYMSGTAANYFAGQIAIGTTTLTNGYFNIAGTQSVVTSMAYIGGTNTFAGNSVALQISSNLTGTAATTSASSLYNNPTFNIATGATLTTLYGILNTPNYTVTSGTTVSNIFGSLNQPNLSTTVTPTNYYGTATTMNFGAGATGGTVPGVYSYNATAGTFNASSTTGATSWIQYAAQNVAGTANNAIGTVYGFYANQAASNTGVTTNYNFYANGTAPNYFAGPVGIQTTAGITGNVFAIGGNSPTSTTSANGMNISQTVQSAVTASYSAYNTFLNTQATAFNLTGLYYFNANQGTIGAGSTVTAQYGFIAASSMVGATNNYGFYGNIPSATGRWNLYMAGTASNYMAGSLGIGTTAVGTTTGSLVVSGLHATSAAAPTIASATTIAPTTQIVFISGTTPIATITAPSPISAGGGQITLIPTGAFTTTTAGNIALASTTVVSKALIMTYDTTTAKWYPSY